MTARISAATLIAIKLQRPAVEFISYRWLDAKFNLSEPQRTAIFRIPSNLRGIFIRNWHFSNVFYKNKDPDGKFLGSDASK